MSSVVKTLTPFLVPSILCKALDRLGFKYQIVGQDVVTDRVDYYGKQTFAWNGERYVFKHESNSNLGYNPWRTTNMKGMRKVSDFLSSVEKEYLDFYQEYIEELEAQRLIEEKRKIEEERKRFVEKQRKSIVELAKARGYSVIEKRKGQSIQLVLVRTT